MWMDLDPSSGIPLYLQIIVGFRRGLVAGTIQPGDRLPSVRELAAELIVSPNTVARAYRELEGDGLILTRQGRGTFVSERIPPVVDTEIERLLEPELTELLARAQMLGIGRETLISLIGERLREEDGEADGN